ncbi:similarity with UbiE/COQ5 methyltransferase [Mycobacterium antarcticum]|uniref:methyltransferase domain-containing protein n=1 Tax=unclassified Mycolicibacterium TaxID=2636767 RepID=UPI00238FCF7E|nr:MULTISPECIES: methyltransferase domain-containing protein [unclassified Mycolicibacterium]BDX34200.1 similarity with UbiE/COQ5 methyltransferase [Mycolicibacterium sp. TUM20985]GLP77402.1 similarity with UbiE/COQ5 methyltransferase [Mycolicibacterium sp. TUM20983]GLP82193.1 similarity with UbiE/COQ5 methyltransferase [Mycolicibacterium sp. TUM20984]
MTLPGPADRRTRALLNRPATVVDGYFDVMGDARVPQTTGQRVMGSTVLPKIYERVWRPVLFWGFTARNTAQEDQRRLRLLDVGPGDTVLDVACGPGNTTRTLVEQVGPDGLTVGVDSSPTMLAQAVRETTPGSPVGYVRGDAVDLPFADATFDAISCYGALYLMADPFGSLREMVRVLKPGGRIAVLTTCARGPAPLRRAELAASRLAPLRLFDVDEITDAMRAAGLIDVTRNVSAASQTVAGRKVAKT